MNPKKALIIIIIILAIVLVILAAFYFINRQDFKSAVDEMEQERLKQEKLINEIIKERAENIKENAQGRPHTQDEIDFILNPVKTVEEDLGIREPEEEVKIDSKKYYNQDKIDEILKGKR